MKKSEKNKHCQRSELPVGFGDVDASYCLRSVGLGLERLLFSEPYLGRLRLTV